MDLESKYYNSQVVKKNEAEEGQFISVIQISDEGNSDGAENNSVIQKDSIGQKSQIMNQNIDLLLDQKVDPRYKPD